MLEIRTLQVISPDDTARLIRGYHSTAQYIIRKTETPERTVITLERTALDRPYIKHFMLDEAMQEQYARVVPQGFSLGAYKGNQLVGIALAEPQWWNGSLWVWEFHVAETHRRRGIGTRLMDALAEQARESGLRVIVCETQNTNVPAIAFYRAAGFEIEGVDLSYYSNCDLTEGEVAIFMKRKLTG